LVVLDRSKPLLGLVLLRRLDRCLDVGWQQVEVKMRRDAWKQKDTAPTGRQKSSTCAFWPKKPKPLLSRIPLLYFATVT
jgi:hypothetical protein